MNLVDIVTRIYVINLPERVDRKKEIQYALSNLGIEWQANKVMCWPAIRPNNSNGYPSIGAYGCFLSHLAALQDAQRAEQGWVLILEDDAIFTPAFTTQLPAIAQLLASEQADLIYLGHCQVIGDTKPELGLSLTTQAIVGAHAYLVRIEYLSTLLPYLEGCLSRPAGDPMGGRLHYDGALSLFRQFNPSCRTWIAQPSLIEQRFSRSDIQAHKWYDRWPILSQCAAWARKIKQAKRDIISL
ncbi:glycosyltransferase family 25 protein [uncultured Deefgea sp.]|uniref:glycosyltransferase family 25 protein n=1 Tax=uncultured Deefgea sp. TaxID=1304914 RepID=UPI002603F150|nr:glycosyltransferase family 25 protein [uncultured Deefgea sp.]